MPDPDNTGEEQGQPRDTRFQPGQSGNPAGRPKGTRNATLMALDAIGEDHAKSILERVIHEALFNGDMRAIDILFRRVWPERRGRNVSFELPPMETAGDLVKAMGFITRAMAEGVITPEEAKDAAATIEIQRRVIETNELARRIAALDGEEANL